MSIWWEHRFGNPEVFSTKISLCRYPEEEFAPQHLSESWGELELTVENQNVCAHWEQGQPITGVRWYLFPLIEWVAANWNPLFHEERLPNRVSGTDAASSMDSTQFPPLGLSEKQLKQWEKQWARWWRRHSIQAGRRGGLFPEVYLRRWRDSVEVSWAPVPITAKPADFVFMCPRGCVRLEPELVARPLFDACVGVLQALQGKLGSCEEVERTLELFKQRQLPSEKDERVGWMTGLAEEASAVKRAWCKVVGHLSEAMSAARDFVLEPESTDLVVSGSCHAALLFGSLSPTVGQDDVEYLAHVLVDSYSEAGETQRLRELVESKPVVSIQEKPWQQGYSLAEEILDELGLANDDWIDVDEILVRLGVSVAEGTLSDRDVRAVTVASPKHTPTIVVNQSYEWNLETHVRRFTLAHELCHLLFDRAFGSRLAIASGPWAPADIEKRANAFAAMLLMPPAAIRRTLDKLGQPVGTIDDLKVVSSSLKTGNAATLEHLFNLGLLADGTRRRLRAGADDDADVEFE